MIKQILSVHLPVRQAGLWLFQLTMINNQETGFLRGLCGSSLRLCVETFEVKNEVLNPSYFFKCEFFYFNKKSFSSKE